MNIGAREPGAHLVRRVEPARDDDQRKRRLNFLDAPAQLDAGTVVAAVERDLEERCRVVVLRQQLGGVRHLGGGVHDEAEAPEQRRQRGAIGVVGVEHEHVDDQGRRRRTGPLGVPHRTPHLRLRADTRVDCARRGRHLRRHLDQSVERRLRRIGPRTDVFTPNGGGHLVETAQHAGRVDRPRHMNGARHVGPADEEDVRRARRMHDPVDHGGVVGIGDDQGGILDRLAKFVVDVAGQGIAHTETQRVALELSETQDCHRQLHAPSIAPGSRAGIPKSLPLSSSDRPSRASLR